MRTVAKPSPASRSNLHAAALGRVSRQSQIGDNTQTPATAKSELARVIYGSPYMAAQRRRIGRMFGESLQPQRQEKRASRPATGDAIQMYSVVRGGTCLAAQFEAAA